MTWMGKRLPHIAEDAATGRLFYRRAFPEPVRSFLEKPRREMKVPLGADGRLSTAAMRRWDTAHRQFEREVQAARAAQSLHAKAEAGAFDTLTPERLQYLADVFARSWHLSDEDTLRTRGGNWADRALAGWAEVLDDFQRWRAEGDLEAMEEWWGRRADLLLAAEGLRLAPGDEDGRERLLWAINAAALELSEAAQTRLKGKVVPIPAQPAKPAVPQTIANPWAPGGNQTIVAREVTTRVVVVKYLEEPKGVTRQVGLPRTERGQVQTLKLYFVDAEPERVAVPIFLPRSRVGQRMTLDVRHGFPGQPALPRGGTPGVAGLSGGLAALSLQVDAIVPEVAAGDPPSL